MFALISRGLIVRPLSRRVADRLQRIRKKRENSGAKRSRVGRSLERSWGDRNRKQFAFAGKFESFIIMDIVHL